MQYEPTSVWSFQVSSGWPWASRATPRPICFASAGGSDSFRARNMVAATAAEKDSILSKLDSPGASLKGFIRDPPSGADK